jgi:2,3-bisphosphoglycerate-independent phosphoglycerate mutase
LEFCQNEKINNVYLHAFLDGRDTPHNSAQNFVEKLRERINELKIGKIATISGRFYAMDRDNRWDRIENAYLAMTQGKTESTSKEPDEAILKSYQKNIYDEQFIPTVIVDQKGEPIAKVKNNDALIFFNFRADRARQLTKAFVLPGFEKFSRKDYLKDLFFVAMTEYEKDLPVSIAFPLEKIENPIARVISDNNLHQLHIAETEKYAHVTFFFNGGREDPFPNEHRVLIPSPSIFSYDQKPEMSAKQLTERVIKEINTGKYAFVVINFANPDMVGHTGNIPAIIRAIETVDQCVGEIVDCVLAIEGGLIITADHGNAEDKINSQTGFINKEHNIDPVPFILVGKPWEGKGQRGLSRDLSVLTPFGILSDITPTILAIMGIPKPSEMTGRNLLKYI